MTVFSCAVRPTSALLLSALVGAALLLAPVTGIHAAENAVSNGKSAVVVTDNGGMNKEGSAKFQGLIPPAGSGEGKTKITYGSAKPDGDDTHPALRLTPDKTELVRLEDDAASVIVGNPEHLGVMLDNPRLVILVPRKPGATYLTMLNREGKVIMQRHVLVSVANKDYIRIRRSCAADAKACQQTSVYYCDGMCHEVDLVENDGKDKDIPPPVGGMRSADADAAEPPPAIAEEPIPEPENTDDVNPSIEDEPAVDDVPEDSSE